MSDEKIDLRLEKDLFISTTSDADHLVLGTILGVDQIIVGEEDSTKQEIVQDEETGLNYSRNAVEEKQYFTLHEQKHRPGFIIDLETGGRGGYPGCVIHGNITETSVELKEKPSDDATTLKTIGNCMVTVLDIDALDQEPYDPGWYKIKYDVEGYVKEEYVTNLRYEDPF